MSRRRRTAAALAGLVAFAALGACARKPPAADEVRVGWTQSGIASWYGPPFHGRRTASGERYDMREITAAHRFLPFGARVRVTRLDDGRSVTVRVNDRGPFHEGRIIDLSKGAARRIGLVTDGVARVRIQVVRMP